MQKAAAEKKFVTKQELLKIFPISLSTVDRLLKAGTIPHLRFGRKSVFNQEAVAAALNQPARTSKRQEETP